MQEIYVRSVINTSFSAKKTKCIQTKGCRAKSAQETFRFVTTKSVDKLDSIKRIRRERSVNEQYRERRLLDKRAFKYLVSTAR